MRKANLATVTTFVGFVFGVSALNVLAPSHSTSLYERRELNQFPPITVESVMSGDFMHDFGLYLQDQAAFRDELRFLKSAVERDAFRKLENNGVYVVDDRVVDQFYGIDDGLIATGARRMNEIIAATGATRAWLALIPTKAQALQPNPAPYLGSDQIAIADAMRSTVSASYVDLMTLAQQHDRRLYYGADPHWTTQGAMTAYVELASAMGASPTSGFRLDTLTTEYVGSEYGKAAAWRVPKDTIQLASNPVIDAMTMCRTETATRVICHDSVYVPPGPESLDAYDVFVGGLAPIIEIDSPEATSDGTLVIFKDSYAHAIAPFLAQHYRKVTLVDLRYVQRRFVLDTVDFAGADVLFLYSTSVLNTDPRALN